MKLSVISAAVLSTLLIASSAMADDNKQEGFNPLGPFRVGILVGAGVPSPLSGQLLLKYKNVVGANFEYGVLPTLHLSLANGIDISQHMWDASLRVYPFKGAFFLGCGIGQQTLEAGGSVTQRGVTGSATAQVNTTFVYPRLGFVHRFSFGLAIGMDAGVELPIGGDSSINTTITNTNELPPGVPVPQLTPPKSASEVTDRIRTMPIPVLHLLQLGYIF